METTGNMPYTGTGTGKQGESLQRRHVKCVTQAGTFVSLCDITVSLVGRTGAWPRGCMESCNDTCDDVYAATIAHKREELRSMCVMGYADSSHGEKVLVRNE